MVSSEEWRFQKHVCIATLFALVTGYADVVSLVRYQAFASILTGNAIWLARVVVDPLSSKHTCCSANFSVEKLPTNALLPLVYGCSKLGW